MDLIAVADELGAALKTIDGLTVPEWGEQRVSPPFALIPLPEIAYDMAYGRTGWRIEDWPLMVLVDRPVKPESRRAVVEYAARSGPLSVKAAIEGHTYTTCDTVRVASCDFDEATYNNVPYLAATFHLDISGKGA
ncbi:hypothetical protein O7634_24575 [Micromonospora sp. WMMD1120]|uniref:hypothetical protein n=1 Tax=Micromonospora sp. WMMD1120 TaxID=3016106 RepID=UPI002417947B|nr:hypothetical protein [Micromonospora sp. WMMD1120]MDG4809939.1 hypothetical protein [Micromonospora sp. WMMD1120]